MTCTNLHVTTLYTMAGVRVGGGGIRVNNNYWLNFSLRKARQALDSEPSFVFGEISFDGYFWKLRNGSLFHCQVCLFQFGQQISLPCFVLDGTEMSSTG